MLGANNCLFPLHTATNFLYLHETNELINEFDIVYLINPEFHVNKVFKYRVEKCKNNTFDNITQPFIKNFMTKNNTCVLALITLHETVHTKENKPLRMLSCVIYTIIDNFVCIDYLACQTKQLN